MAADNDYDLSHLNQPPEEETAAGAPPVVPSAPETVPPKPHEHPEWLVHQARFFGATDEELRTTPSDQLNTLVIQAARKQAMIEAQDARRVDAERNEPQIPKPPPQAEGEDQLIGYLRDELRMDPKAIALFESQQKKIKELESRTAKIDEFEKRETARILTSADDAYDAAFEQLGEQGEAFFGKGDRHTLSAQSDEMALRVAAIKLAGADPKKESPVAIQRKVFRAGQTIIRKALAAQLKQPAKEPPKEPTKPPSAYDEALAQAASKPKNGAKRVTEQEWDEGALATPTHKKPKPSRGEEAAREAVRAFYNQHNVYDEPDDEQLRNVPD